VLIANYQRESTKSSEITKTKFMQIIKNQIIRHFSFFAAKPQPPQKFLPLADKKKQELQADEQAR